MKWPGFIGNNQSQFISLTCKFLWPWYPPVSIHHWYNPNNTQTMFAHIPKWSQLCGNSPPNHGFYWCLIWGMGLFHIIPPLSQWSMHVLMVPFQTVVKSQDGNQVWRNKSHGDSMRRGVAAGKCCIEMLPLPSANQRWLADPLFLYLLMCFFPLKPSFYNGIFH